MNEEKKEIIVRQNHNLIEAKYKLNSEEMNFILILMSKVWKNDNDFKFSEITFKEYQKLSKKTAIYPNIGNNFIYPTLGLAGEAGEVAEKIKKVLRDREGILDKKVKEDIKKELGDVLWYVSQLATELGFSLDSVASFNIEKLSSRRKRDKIHGSGDNR